MSLRNLLVCEVGTDAGITGPVFEVFFDPNLPAESAREINRTPSKISVSAPEAHRPIKGEFDEQVLNRLFTDAFLRFRPQTVIFDLVSGATLDLIRLAKLFGARVAIRMPSPAVLPESGTRAFAWLSSALEEADKLWVSALRPHEYTAIVKCLPKLSNRLIDRQALDDWIKMEVDSDSLQPFDYELYEFGIRNHGLLKQIQRREVDFFRGCKHVLDVACGAGIFLDLLTKSGIRASGVERNPSVVRYARGLGFNVHQADAFDYVRAATQDRTIGTDRYDGIHCSHFVEHLPVAAVKSLLSLLYEILVEDGVLLLVFPNPESIRSQLLGFWRDPEHIRFYHPELIELMAKAVGFEPVAGNYRPKGHDVMLFPIHMPAWPAFDEMRQNHDISTPSIPWWRSLLGFTSTTQKIKALQQANAALTARLEVLEARSRACERAMEMLWAVNQTWAWDDDAILYFRKPVSSDTLMN